MADIPREVLSEHFQERMRGRVLKTAVFLTFRLDPGFFEQEVLPVFLDVPLSHEPTIRLIQLEDASAGDSMDSATYRTSSSVHCRMSCRASIHRSG